MTRMNHIRQPRQNFKRAAQGLTLIELIIAIIIGLIVLAAAVGMISSAMSKSDVSNDSSGITGLIANTKTLRANGTYGTSGTSLNSALIALKAVPSTLGVDGANITNNWGGAVTVASTGTGYTVTTAGIPAEACIEQVTKLSKTMLNTAINGGTPIVGQVSVAQATAGCSVAGNGNAIVWTASS